MGTQDVPCAAATGFDLLQLPDGEQWLWWQLLAQTMREEKSVARLGSRVFLLNILDIQNKRKSFSPSALVALGPHHSPGVTFQRCPHLSEHSAPPASLLLVPNQVQRNKFKRKKFKIAWPKQQIAALNIKFCLAFYWAS